MLPKVNDVETAGEALEETLLQRLREAQEQLALLREQVMQTQRLATIGTIAAVIAHEFNNILTPVISYSQFALQSAQSDKPDHELIKKALNKSFQGATKAGRICTSMLGLARGESEHGVVSLQNLVDETLLVLARDPQKDGIGVRVQVQAELTVHGDAVQLEQVLLNLLINARQAMLGKAGSITIKGVALEETKQVRLSVIDTGPGIAPKNLEKIFEPFFTTKGTARRGENRGTGLGLSICKEIIDAHAGQIEVISDIGKGTTFQITLPKAG